MDFEIVEVERDNIIEYFSVTIEGFDSFNKADKFMLCLTNKLTELNMKFYQELSSDSSSDKLRYFANYMIEAKNVSLLGVKSLIEGVL